MGLASAADVKHSSPRATPPGACRILLCARSVRIRDPRPAQDVRIGGAFEPIVAALAVIGHAPVGATGLCICDITGERDADCSTGASAPRRDRWHEDAQRRG